MNSNRTVVVLGASDDPERYSHKAVSRLSEQGYRVVPVNPSLDRVLGIPAVPSLDRIAGPVETLTVYLSPKRSSPLAAAILALRPRRAIFNPGAENPELEAELAAAGIDCLRACTLVLLATGKF